MIFSLTLKFTISFTKSKCITMACSELSTPNAGVVMKTNYAAEKMVISTPVKQIVRLQMSHIWGFGWKVLNGESVWSISVVVNVGKSFFVVIELPIVFNFAYFFFSAKIFVFITSLMYSTHWTSCWLPLCQTTLKLFVAIFFTFSKLNNWLQWLRIPC